MRVLRLLIVLACASVTSGCYVVSVAGLGDAAATFDESLLGRWRNVEDDVDLVLERDEWSTYGVTLRDRTGSQRFTGRLATIGGARYFDLTIHAGTDPGPALLPVHIIGRITLRDGSLLVELLDYDWFRGRLKRGSLTIPALLDARDTVLIAASRAQLARWLSAHASSPALFSEAMTLAREPESSK
jgi:hypothetical protein